MLEGKFKFSLHRHLLFIDLWSHFTMPVMPAFWHFNSIGWQYVINLVVLNFHVELFEVRCVARSRALGVMGNVCQVANMVPDML